MTQRPYITCRELISFIADYLDGTLGARERHEFERHLSVCPSCVAYLASYEETIRMARATETAPSLLGDDAPTELIEAILASTSRSR
jgi:anti-sigma factor RsiW